MNSLSLFFVDHGVHRRIVGLRGPTEKSERHEALGVRSNSLPDLFAHQIDGGRPLGK